MEETSRIDPADAQRRPRRHARAGCSTRSTIGLRSAAWKIAPWLLDSLWRVLPPRFKVADVRRGIHSWLNAIYASAERDYKRPQRGPRTSILPISGLGRLLYMRCVRVPTSNLCQRRNHRARRIVQDPHQIVAMATDASKRKCMMQKRWARGTALALSQ